VAVSFGLIYLHLKNYTKPQQQRYIIRILVMVPIYSVDTWLSLLFYKYSVFFDVVRDCYEAYVIFSLFQLLIEYLGGYETSKNILEKKPSFSPIMPFCCITMQPHRWFLRASMRLTLQYVLIRPVLTCVTVILHVSGKYCPGQFKMTYGYPWITGINFISVTLAMFALLQFYVLFREDMKPYNIGAKFLAVKFVIFLSFWQTVIVSIAAFFHLIAPIKGLTMDQTNNCLENALLSVEMLGAAVWHIYAFSYKDYQLAAKKELGPHSPLLLAMRDVANPVDVLGHSAQSFRPKRKTKSRQPFQNLEDAWVYDETETDVYPEETDESESESASAAAASSSSTIVIH